MSNYNVASFPVLYSDSDANIVYAGNWIADWSTTEITTEPNYAVGHATSTYGSSFSFRYYGGGFYVDSSQSGPSVTYEFSIDGVKYEQSEDGINWTPGAQEQGVHNVVVTNLGNSQDAIFVFTTLTLYTASATNTTSTHLVALSDNIAPPAPPVSPSSTTAIPPAEQTTFSPPIALPSQTPSKPTSSQTDVASGQSSVLQGIVPTVDGTVPSTDIVSSTNTAPGPAPTSFTGSSASLDSGPVQTIVFAAGTDSKGVISYSTMTKMGGGAGTLSGAAIPSSVGGGGMPNGGIAQTHAEARVHAMLAGILPAVTFVIALSVCIWIYRRRRSMNRFRVGLEDEQRLVRHESLQTMMTTRPTPFRLVNLHWFGPAPASKKHEGFIAPSNGISSKRFRAPWVPRSRDTREVTQPATAQDNEAPSRASTRPSSITAISLAPEYESRASWPSANLWTPPRVESVSDVPPTYYTEDRVGMETEAES